MASGQPPYYNPDSYQGYGSVQQPTGYGSVQQPTTPSTSYPAPPAAHIFSMQQDHQAYQQQGYGSNQYQQYAQQGYGQSYDYHQGYGPGNYQTQGFPQQGPSPDQAFAIPGLNAPALNPMGVLLKGSSLFSGGGQWGQQYMQGVQQRMGWLSGGALNHQFAISNQYVMNKLLILLVPYFKRWSFSRQAEQIAGNHKYRPPRMDVNAPDLYIPLVSAWTYVVLLCTNALLLGKYKPDIVYSKVWYAGGAWAIHAGAAWVLLRMMSLPSALPLGELMAYTGYVFVPACCTLLVGMIGGKWAWWCAWMYGSLASAVFLVRTIKRVLFQETRSYGANLTLTNYLLLALAAMQFPLLLWLCSVQLPVWALHVPSHAPVVSSPMSVKSAFMGSGAGGAAAGMPSPARIG